MNDEDAEHDQPEEVTENAPGQNGLSWLMSRLSFVARRLIINKPSTAELVANPVSTNVERTTVVALLMVRSCVR
jgi:hypothetical protein